jgi:transcriptional regulator with GAF, ATPase, and Fis domain
MTLNKPPRPDTVMNALGARRVSQVLTRGDRQPAVHHANLQRLRPPVTGLDAGVLEIVLKDLSFALSEAAEVLQQTALVNKNPADEIEQGIDFYREVNRFKIGLIRTALAHANGKQKRAAKLLGIRLSTLNAMIKRLGIGIKPVIASKKM